MEQTLQFGRDLLLRLVVIAVVTAISAGGVVYFVVDVALRGVESSIETTNLRIGDVNGRFDQVDMSLRALNDGITAIREDISNISSALKQSQDGISYVVQVSAAETLRAMTATVDFAEMARNGEDLAPEEVAALDALAADLRMSIGRLEALHATYPLIFSDGHNGLTQPPKLSSESEE